MLEVARWAADQFHHCLLDSESPMAEAARVYLGERGLLGETVRRYGLGYAPPSGQWLVQRAEDERVSLDLLEKVGLIARRTERPGFYDRFRDRVQFPIRDVRGQVVGFGGRILPGSPFASRGPKYYNSSDTPLFNKSELLYGLDAARQAAASAGFLAIVEGYTDVLMAHQMGILPVVATMGTALNAKHVQNLRRFVARVILVFDADAGGDTGVDRALEIFASHDLDLAIATLPEGLDPCDLLLKQGPEAFRKVLESAVDALEFKLTRVLADRPGGQAPGLAGPLSVEGQRRAVDAVLGVIALAPPLTGQAGTVKTELMISRIARRLVLKEETVWARLEELRQRRRGPEKGAIHQPEAPLPHGGGSPTRAAKAAPEERELLEVLLAKPELVPLALAEVAASQIEHPGLLRLLVGLYDLHRAGKPATLDQLRPQLDAALAEHALKLQDVGGRNSDPAGWLNRLLQHFRERRLRPVTEELHNQLHAASDHSTALELLRQLQNRPFRKDEG